MISRLKFTKVVSVIICMTLLIQMVWTDIALAVCQPYDPTSYDAIRNGVSLAYSGVTVDLPQAAKTVTNVYNFVAKPGADTMLGQTVTQRIDSTKLDPLSKPYMVLWQNRYSQEYFAYDFIGLTADPYDTMYFSHVIIDTSNLDSSIMFSGDSARIESLVNKINMKVTNKVTQTVNVTNPNDLVALYWDRDRSRTFTAGDSLIDSTSWFRMCPGESLYVLVKTIIPMIVVDSVRDTVSLICRTEKNSPTNRPLVKTYKDVITIELMQAIAAESWITPDTVVAGSWSIFTYNFRLILGTADDFKIVNPFANPPRYSPADTRNYDSMAVTQVTFGVDTFSLGQSPIRLAN